MAFIPEGEPDFPDALSDLVQRYMVDYGVGVDDIKGALQRQIDLLSTETGSENGAPPPDNLPSPTPPDEGT